MEPVSSEPSQTLTTPNYDELILLLRSKLGVGSDADISLSAREVRELIATLSAGKDGTERLPDVEHELSKAKEKLTLIDFYCKYGDYAAKFVQYLKVPGPDVLNGQVTRIFDDLENLPSQHKLDLINERLISLDLPVTLQAAYHAIEVYARRCRQFHSENVYNASQSGIGLQARTDLDDLSTSLPHHWASCLPYWQEIIACVEDKVRCEAPETEKPNLGQGRWSPRWSSPLTRMPTPTYTDLLVDRVIPPTIIPLLIDHGCFRVSPVRLEATDILLQKRGSSVPREMEVASERDLAMMMTLPTIHRRNGRRQVRRREVVPCQLRPRPRSAIRTR